MFKQKFARIVDRILKIWYAGFIILAVIVSYKVFAGSSG
jgi:hypothetical protein